MSGEILIFWLIHLVIFIVMPVLMYFGCCKKEAEQNPAQEPQFIYPKRS